MREHFVDSKILYYFMFIYPAILKQIQYNDKRTHSLVVYVIIIFLTNVLAEEGP